MGFISKASTQLNHKPVQQPCSPWLQQELHGVVILQCVASGIQCPLTVSGNSV
jgi:hypothetical protein